MQNEEQRVGGSANFQDHYKKAAMQPIEVMQALLSPAQFRGFLLGNFIKYNMRAPYKGQTLRDREKAKQYLYWLELARQGVIIDPVKHIPPKDWEGTIAE